MRIFPDMEYLEDRYAAAKPNRNYYFYLFPSMGISVRPDYNVFSRRTVVSVDKAYVSCWSCDIICHRNWIVYYSNYPRTWRINANIHLILDCSCCFVIHLVALFASRLLSLRDSASLLIYRVN